MVENRCGYLIDRVCPSFAREYRNSAHLALAQQE